MTGGSIPLSSFLPTPAVFGMIEPAAMHLVAQYRQFAIDYRRLAAMLKNAADRHAMELFAIGWDRAAEKREAMLAFAPAVRSIACVTPAVVSVPRASAEGVKDFVCKIEL